MNDKHTKHEKLKQTQDASTNPSESNSLVRISPFKNATPKQGVLDLGIVKDIEIDGIGMGVLSDGTAYLTLRGLSRLCGVAHRQIQDINAEWNEVPPKARISLIKRMLLRQGIELDQPYLAISEKSGASFFAYTDSLCMAVLEYYAFDAGLNVKETAQMNFRRLAGRALREFIYTQVGYDPNSSVPDVWKQFHDRLSLTYNSVPHGYFGIFKEMADMVVTLGQAGLRIDDKFVPDISVGLAWSKHWCDSKLHEKYGDRIKFEHNYPSYFPQAKSNPQEPWCYPELALGEFRRWLRVTYIGQGKLAKYITDKVRQNELPASFAQLAIAAYTGE